jgi:hypothetical protein
MSRDSLMKGSERNENLNHPFPVSMDYGERINTSPFFSVFRTFDEMADVLMVGLPPNECIAEIMSPPENGTE